MRKELFAPKANQIVDKPKQLQRNEKNGALPFSFCQPLLLGSLCHPAQHSLFLKLKCRNICLPRPPDHISYNLLYFKRRIMNCIVCPRPQKALSLTTSIQGQIVAPPLRQRLKDKLSEFGLKQRKFDYFL